MANPTEFNQLSNVKFKLNIHKMPDVTYWVQSTILPSITLENAIFPGMRRDIPLPGQKVEFENLTVNFIVDQSLHNYQEIVEWFMAIAQAKEVGDMVSDLSLHFLNGDNEVSRTIHFVGAYPTLLTELSMNSDDSDASPVTCSVSFNYAYFKFSDTGLPVWARSKMAG